MAEARKSRVNSLLVPAAPVLNHAAGVAGHGHIVSCVVLQESKQTAVSNSGLRLTRPTEKGGLLQGRPTEKGGLLQAPILPPTLPCSFHCTHLNKADGLAVNVQLMQGLGLAAAVVDANLAVVLRATVGTRGAKISFAAAPKAAVRHRRWRC